MSEHKLTACRNRCLFQFNRAAEFLATAQKCLGSVPSTGGNPSAPSVSLAMTQRYSHLTPASLDSTIRLLDNRPIRRANGDNLETPEGRNS